MLNVVVLMGRMTRDPELRRTNSGKPVASFAIAVDRDFTPQGQEKETDFIDIVAWNGTAEFVEKYLKKGSMIALKGRLQLRDWTGKDGKKRRTAEVVADQVWFGESKKSQEGNDTTYGRNTQQGAAQSVGYGQMSQSYGYQQPQFGGQQYSQQGFGGYNQQGFQGQVYQPPQQNFARIDHYDDQLPF